MITDNGMIISKIKKTAWVLLCICAVLVFASCSGSEIPSDNPFEGLEFDDDSENSVEGAALYRIILPEDATPELLSGANTLKEGIAAATGVDTELVYDYETATDIDGCFEILLGGADRTEAAQTLKGLKRDDFVCRFYGGALILGGVTHGATVSAIERFCAEILPDATSVVLMREEQAFEYFGEYPLDEVELNGFSLYEYSVLYPKENENRELSLAEELCSVISEKSGYVLKTVADTEYVGGKYISVGFDGENLFTVHNDTAVIGAEGQNVYLLGADRYSISAAVNKFAEMLLSGSPLSMTETVVISTYNPKTSLAVISPYSSEVVSIDQVNGITSAIRSSGAGIMLLPPASEGLFGRVSFGLSEYETATAKTEDGQVLAILYKDSAIKLVGEIKTERLFGCVILYAEFSLVGSGERMLVFNVYCGESADVAWIANFIGDMTEGQEAAFVAVISDETEGHTFPDFGSDAFCAANRMEHQGYYIFADASLAVDIPQAPSYGAFASVDSFSVKKG